MKNPSGLTDQELIAEVDELARCERAALPHFLACLSEVERRRLHIDLGHQNLFDYCVGRLKYSEAGAMRRIHAARAAAKHGEIYAYLRDGELNLAVVALLSPHLNINNALTLLSSARGKSKREIETLVVELAHRRAEEKRVEPEPDPQKELVFSPPPVQIAVVSPSEPSSPIASALPIETDAPAQPPSAELDPDAASLAPSPIAAAEEPAGEAPTITPSESPRILGAESSRVIETHRDMMRLESPGVLRVGFRAPVSFREKLERVRGLIGWRFDGRIATTLDIILEDYLNRHDPGRRKSTLPRAQSAQPTRRVRRWVRDVVWRRDEGRCAFVAPDGVRCEARTRLEYDHIRPWALGGSSDDPANIRLLCRAHNLHAARKIFGERVPAARPI